MVVASSIMVLGLWAIGYAGSEVQEVFKYDLRFNKLTYASHSVTFGHSTHAMTYKIACIRCHHTLEQGVIAPLQERGIKDTLKLYGQVLSPPTKRDHVQRRRRTRREHDLVADAEVDENALAVGRRRGGAGRGPTLHGVSPLPR